ncbi:hypothetical protein OG978_05195 [Streptomyces sp. NBC_01591]|uniref:hypothetical protein n=1 Tax=Streptomyces sp. NBC_01591 TaxID=2975888 RepID=UPI002DD9EFF2|nr:hypothetical protein [Streptomyces sp. NBC_01591]WSD66829.1 hypothetical protein OG978_05195 [Streptomyces sp. NBC_01591]
MVTVCGEERPSDSARGTEEADVIDLLVLDHSVGPEAATQPVTSFGGLPAAPPGTAFTWPRQVRKTMV